MRIFTTMVEAYKEVERELVEMGVEVHSASMQDKNVKDNPDYITKELQGYCYKITTHSGLIDDFVKLGGNHNYAATEFVDRVSSMFLNPGDAYKHREEVWKEFLHEGKFSYTYNERIRTQIDRIKDELRIRPNTRQAIITVYDHHQDICNLGGKSRIPCSMYYQFLIRPRQGKLVMDIIYTMRSCDIYTHLIYDIYITMKFQEHMANAVGIEPGHFTHFIGSLHAYRKDYFKKGVF